MKQYKIVEANNSKDAERKMNEMAKEGWRVVATTYWMHYKALLIITFEKDM